MLQTFNANLVMDKSPLVDGKVSIRKLGEKTIGLRMVYARSDGDVYRGVPIGVSLISTLGTLEETPVSYAFSSAFGADVRCASCIDGYHKPVELPCYGFECHSESVVRHSLSFAISFSIPFRVLEVFEVFQGDECVVLFSKPDDFMGDLPASCSCVVTLIFSKPSEGLLGASASIVGIASEFASSKVDVSLFVAHILTEVKLPQNSAFSIDDGDGCQPFNSNINAENRLIILLHLKIFLQGNINIGVAESEKRGLVALLQHLSVSSVVSILTYWYCHSSVEGRDGNHWISPFSDAEPSTPRNVVGHRNSTDFAAIVQDCYSVFEQVVGNLTVQSKGSNLPIEHSLKLMSLDFNALRHDEGEGFSIPRLKLQEITLFSSCRLQQIQGYRFNDFHPKTRINYTKKNDLNTLLQFLPPMNRWASLEK